MKPFSTSVLKQQNKTWVFATTTKICTKGCSTRGRPHTASQQPSRVLLLDNTSLCVRCQSSIGNFSSRHLSAIHFRGRFIRQVSCYTLLSGFRLPWPPSCCLYESTPFPGLWLSVALRLLNSRTFGSSHIASSAYQMWPTCGLQYLRTPLKRFDEGRASLPLKSLRISQGMSFPEKLHVLLCAICLLIIRFTW